jgi:hypothetical protein
VNPTIVIAVAAMDAWNRVGISMKMVLPVETRREEA